MANSCMQTMSAKDAKTGLGALVVAGTGPVLVTGDVEFLEKLPKEYQTPGDLVAEYDIMNPESKITIQKLEKIRHEAGSDEIKPSHSKMNANLVKKFVSGEKLSNGPINVLDFMLPNASQWLPESIVRLDPPSLLPQLRTCISQRPGETHRGMDNPRLVDETNFTTLASRGAHTPPHQDNNGFDTFLMCTSGELLFGWVDDPDEEFRKAWREDTEELPPGRYRVIAMRPGDLIWFPAGTIHFVLRPTIKECNTALLGGHTLSKKALRRWVSTAVDNHRYSNMTNETATVLPYIITAAQMMSRCREQTPDNASRKARQANDSAENDVDKFASRWGGYDEIDWFFKTIPDLHPGLKETKLKTMGAFDLWKKYQNFDPPYKAPGTSSSGAQPRPRKATAAKETAPKATAPKRTAPKRTAPKRTAVEGTAAKRAAAEETGADDQSAARKRLKG